MLATEISAYSFKLKLTISKFLLYDRSVSLVVSLRCLDELDLSVGTGILFQATDQEIELAPYMTVVQ